MLQGCLGALLLAHLVSTALPVLHRFIFASLSRCLSRKPAARSTRHNSAPNMQNMFHLTPLRFCRVCIPLHSLGVKVIAREPICSLQGVGLAAEATNPELRLGEAASPPMFCPCFASANRRAGAALVKEKMTGAGADSAPYSCSLRTFMCCRR